MSALDSVELVVSPKMGVSWNDVARECIELSCKEKRNVTFIFNGYKYIIKLEDLLKSVKEETEK